MTTTLPIPSGPTNKEIIDRAYQVLGISDAMFGRTSDEYAEAFGALSAMMYQWPFDQLGWFVEDAAGLRIEEESNIDRKWLDAIAYTLAERVAPTLGKVLQPEARKVKNASYSSLCASVANVPEAQFPNRTAAGAGNRYRTFLPPPE